MERWNVENYEQIEQLQSTPKQESSASTIGGLVLNFIVFESIFSGMGALGGTSVLGASESYSHAVAEVAGVNNIASAGNENRLDKA